MQETILVAKVIFLKIEEKIYPKIQLEIHHTIPSRKLTISRPEYGVFSGNWSTSGGNSGQ